MSFRKSFVIFVNPSSTTVNNPFDLRFSDDFFAGISFQSDEICPEILSLLNKKNLWFPRVCERTEDKSKISLCAITLVRIIRVIRSVRFRNK